MNEGSEPREKSPGESAWLLSSARWAWRLLLVSLLAVFGLAVYSAHLTLSATAQKQAAEAATVRSMGLVEPTAKGLASQFTDSQGRLLADPPAAADQLQDPQTIVVAHLEGTDAENPSISWAAFEAHLADATGRKVVDRVFDNSPDDLAQFKDGSVTLVALHAADTPFLVDNYGYQPAAVLGTDVQANGNRLDIIVPTDSSINSLADLKGRTLVCTVPSSITGYRAAIALLMENQGLRPNIDYFVTWSLGQKRSILGVASKEYGAAAVSDEKLRSLIADGQLAATDYRMIYQSEVIPRTTIGWFYNLKPDLAAKIRDAILSYNPQPATQPADSDAAPALHFIAIDYKKDFQLMRQMDDRFDPRFASKPTKTHADATAS